MQPAAFQLAVVAGGVADWTIAVPATAGLTGTHLFQQALVLDAVNAAGAVVSNAVEIVVGIR